MNLLVSGWVTTIANIGSRSAELWPRTYKFLFLFHFWYASFTHSCSCFNIFSAETSWNEKKEVHHKFLWISHQILTNLHEVVWSTHEFLWDSHQFLWNPHGFLSMEHPWILVESTWISVESACLSLSSKLQSKNT